MYELSINIKFILKFIKIYYFRMIDMIIFEIVEMVFVI